MSKKKLDELFQETFLEHNEVPDEKVWDSIAASLDKKKKKRLLPLWWALSGIAAALVLALVIFNPFTSENSTEQIITDVEQTDSSIEENGSNATKEQELLKNDENSIKIADDEKEVPVLEKNDTQVVTTEDKENSSFNNTANKESTQRTNIGEKWVQKDNAVAQSQDQKIKNTSKESEGIKANSKNDLITSNTNIAQTKKITKQNNENQQRLKNQDTLEKILSPTKETEVAANDEKKSQEESANNMLNDSNSLEKISAEGNTTEVANNQTETKQTTSDPINKKSIFDEISSQEEEAVADNTSKKWSAGPSVAPVYFNAIGEGSSVHSIFVANSKSGKVNMSYGVSVGYEINSKLKIRSGIHSVNFGYDTNEISFSSSLTASTNGQIDNIDYTLTARNLVVSSKPGGSALSEAPVNSLDVSAQNPERDGFMTQQLGYLEIPVELNYTLIDKKFGLNLIGGVSSLFLMDNSVALTSGSLTTEMGEANNVNDLNFSANFGLGVNYKFSQNIQLNIEPVFKYQLNTFSETAGTFNPYALGIYSGLSFKF